MVWRRQNEFDTQTGLAIQCDNQRPITCLNTVYQWYTTCLLVEANQHLRRYGLIQQDRRGAKENCRGSVDNLLIDRIVCEDAERGKTEPQHGLGRSC